MFKVKYAKNLVYGIRRKIGGKKATFNSQTIYYKMPIGFPKILNIVRIFKKHLI